MVLSSTLENDFSDWLDSLEDDGTLKESSLPGSIEPVFTPLKSSIEERIRNAYYDFQKRFRLPALTGITDPLSEKNFPKLIHAIRSMVGDDEVITTDCLMYALLCVIVGPIISMIKTSWEDVQFHQHLFNYAEGWVFLPPSMDSDFESVNKYSRGNGVPFVLDPVKFKNLSAVRKQSEMERDLPSKFRNLAESAAWTNPGWITWNLHQFAMLLGIEVFDFMRSKIFPFLFSYEGGCGGAPPWNNLYTAAGAIYRYRGGRAQRGIIGIMTESNQLFRGEVSPADCFFTKNLNLAMSGDERWNLIRGKLEQIRTEHLELGLEYFPEVTQCADEMIPPELAAVSTTIHPSDALTGVAVSFLREKGYLTTELDLVMRIQERARLDAIWGHIPLKEVADQIEIRKNEYRDNYLEILSQLSFTKMAPQVKQRIENLSGPFGAESILDMESYYRHRIEQNSFFNSFIYNERIRVFKTEDIEAYFDKGVAGIRNQFCSSIGSSWRPEFRRSIELPEEKRKFDDIEDWLKSGPLDELFSGALPPGIGPDDSRIARTLGKSLEIANYADGFLILIISSDRGLINACQHVLSHNTTARVRVNGLHVEDYLRWCITEPKYRVPGKAKATPWLQRSIFNLVEGEMIRIHGPLLELLEREAQMMWACKRPRFLIEYDFPNINRSCHKYKVDKISRTIREYSGGYLSKIYVSAQPSFAMSELDKVVELDEFDYTRIRVQYPADLVSTKPIRLFSAKRQRENIVANWRT